MAEWAWADVLVWDAALAEVERVEGLGRLADMVTAASLMATAVHQPTKLAEAREQMLGAGRLPAAGGGTDSRDPGTATAALLERIAMAERVARRMARSGQVGDPFLEALRREH